VNAAYGIDRSDINIKEQPSVLNLFIYLSLMIA